MIAKIARKGEIIRIELAAQREEGFELERQLRLLRGNTCILIKTCSNNIRLKVYNLRYCGVIK